MFYSIFYIFIRYKSVLNNVLEPADNNILGACDYSHSLSVELI